ncbi:MAG: hypothetical protein ACOC80_15085 [Petrotogales bacterium]
MIRKVVGMIVIVGLFALCFAPLSVSKEPVAYERYFENRYVYAFGRFKYVKDADIFIRFKPCHISIIGELNITATGTTLEHYKISITNLSHGFFTKKRFNGNVTLIMENLTGVFFYSAFTKRERIIPPLLIFSCYAEKVWVKWK